MSRIAATFTQLHAQGCTALIPFVTAGFPFADITPELMHAMVAGGADVIELGVPFSDPSADGPVIQRAGDKALSYGIGLAQVFDMVRVFRSQNNSTPVVLMGYANPVERYNQIHSTGGNAFVQDAATAGVDGVLIVDYPPEECQDLAADLKAQGLDMIYLLAPTSTENRVRQVYTLASGYVYYVSLKGVTGTGTPDIDAINSMLNRIRLYVRIPLAVGFGIRDATTARAISQVADAVVIGSQIIRLVGDLPRDRVASVAEAFIREIRTALDVPMPPPLFSSSFL